jgi:hypothetical protein
VAKKLRLIATNPASIPAGLGKHGSSLWRRIMAEFNIQDVGGKELLFQACAASDRAEDCREAIKKDGQLISTKGGPRAHALIREELNARSFLVRTLQKLGVTLEPIKAMGRPPKPLGVKLGGVA